MKRSSFFLVISPLLIVICVTLFISGYLWGEIRLTNGNIDLVASIQNIPRKVHATFSSQNDTKKLNALATYQWVAQQIRTNYYDSEAVKEPELSYGAIRGLMGSLGDPYTRFLDPKEFDQMQEDTRGDFVGIGAELESDPLGALIRRPIPNSPAIRKGIQSGDIIIGVDGKDLTGMEVDEIVRLIRGEKGTAVKLTIKRKDVEKPIEFSIVRDRIISPTVEYFMEDEENKIGRLWLGQFNDTAASQIDAALLDLESQKMKGLIFDLRFNPGGLLDVAIAIASRFSQKSPVVIVQSGDGRQENEPPIASLFHKHEYPIVILVNEGSASASEILTGYFKDHKLAVIVGEKTFGKGLVQSLIPMQGSTAVAITTAKYLTPLGIDINRKHLPNGKYEGGGIVPDVEVKNTDEWTFKHEKGDKEDVQLLKALEIVRQKIQEGTK